MSGKEFFRHRLNHKEVIMYYLSGYKHCLMNLGSLAKQYYVKPIITESDLKNAFLNFLAEVQPRVPKPSKLNNLFAIDSYTKKALISIFNADGILNCTAENIKGKEEEYTENEEILLKHLYLQGIDYISNFEPNLEKLFKLVINYIFFSKNHINKLDSSSSNALGVIWSAGHLEWEVPDVAEFLIQELTHHLVFIDEQCSEYYKDYTILHNKDNWIYSTILDTPSSIDRAIHSVLIAHEIIEFRKQIPDDNACGTLYTNNRQLTTQMVDDIESIMDVNKRVNTLHKHVTEKLLMCKYSCNTLV